MSFNIGELGFILTRKIVIGIVLGLLLLVVLAIKI